MDQNESEEIAIISAQGDIVHNADLAMAEAEEVINAPELIEDAEQIFAQDNLIGSPDLEMEAS